MARGRKPRNGKPKGRPPGSRNRITELMKRRAEEGGELPLEYMLRVMRDSTQDDPRRDEMAKSAAPYLHAKLAAIAVSTDTKQLLAMITQSVEPGEAADMYLQSLKAIEDVSQVKDNGKIIDVKPD